MAIPLYHVDADIATGEWFGTPETTGRWVEELPWCNEPDSDDYHCDTYEIEVDGVFGTRALKVFWVGEV